MSEDASRRDDEVFLSRATEATIRIGVLALFAAWCLLILSPFVAPVLWGIIIAVAGRGLAVGLTQRLGGRAKLAAVLFTLLGLLLVIAPMALLGETLVSGAHELSAVLEGGTLRVPPPPASVAQWPVVGAKVFEAWSLASTNLESALLAITPQLQLAGHWLLVAGAGAGVWILQFILAIVIAGILQVNAEAGGQITQRIAVRLGGPKGGDMARLAEATVRSVAKGILGVAIIQSTLAGLGFLVVGVPGAGLWAMVALLLCVVQIGPLLVMLPIIIWVFTTASTAVAVAFTIWCVAVALMDNILKPMLLGRGVTVPVAVIFLGAIGGFLSMGIIGLFVGSISLTLGYTLLMAWLGDEEVVAEVA